jgi:glycosyltransferase involved in cell wall biosynthesis
MYRWADYIKEFLPICEEVWVPSKCTATRIHEHTIVKGEVRVIKPPITLWEPPEPCYPGNRVVDVMRHYATPDSNQGKVAAACKELEIPYIESRCTLTWDEYRRTIASARLLVSSYYEASTGGLTLLEGYWHGVPCLLSDSTYHGAKDYFNDRAAYFQWDNWDDLKQKLRALYDNPPKIDISAVRKWISKEHTDSVFALQIADRIKELVKC